VSIGKLRKTAVLLFLAAAFPRGLFPGDIDWISAHNKVYRYPERDFSRVGSDPGKEEYYKAAVYLLTAGKESKAAGFFRKILELSEDSPEGLWGVGELKRRERLTEESIEILDSVLGLNPSFVPAKISRAYIYFEEGSYGEAISLVSEVLEEEDNTDTANLIRAHLIAGGAMGMQARDSFFIGKISRGLAARRHLAEAGKIDPDFPEFLFARGSYYLEAPRIAGGDIEKARKYLMRALEKLPGSADIHARLAQLYLKKGETDKYYEYLERALEIDPRNTLAEKLREAGEALYE